MNRFYKIVPNNGWVFSLTRCLNGKWVASTRLIQDAFHPEIRVYGDAAPDPESAIDSLVKKLPK